MKVSVIVPIYNQEKYLKKCIDSLVKQEGDYEFILVNDGSKDNSEKIIKSYRDKRIKYFKNKNRGIGYTRNFGISKATGKYLMFLDSDDYLEENAIKILLDNILDNDILIFNINKIIKGKKIKDDLIKYNTFNLIKSPDNLLGINLAVWNKIYLTSLIKENNIKFPENLKYEDAPFMVQALIAASKISTVDNYLYNYVIHSNSETTIRDSRVFDIFKILDLIRENKKEYLNETIKYLIVKILTNYTIQQRKNINKINGMKFIDEAFLYMKKYVPDYKDNKYYPKRGIRAIIEKNKLLTKVYCLLYLGWK